MNPSRPPFGAALVAISLAAIPLSVDAAPGIGMAWNHCQGEVGATQNRVFACDTNVGSEIAYGTFALDSPMLSVLGIDTRIDVVAASPILPAWWGFDRSIPSCRAGSLSVPPLPDPAATVCEDWAQGVASGNYTVIQTTSANSYTIPVSSFSPIESPMDLVDGVEYFLFSMRIDHARTVGTGACGGCTIPVCITFTQVRLNQYPGPERRLLTTPSIQGGNIITWQNGFAGSPTCMGATPTSRATWGSVKALYR